ncbi:aromatic ring-hydroxylating dioxygenase subunit alpha [bacterium]|nr:aromatic ring-hydroxylating dioxygenase subunit alpha [bacterium]
MNLKDFWYIAATSSELAAGTVLGKKLLDEPLVLFRDAEGKPVAMQDRCLHRNAKLSAGFVKEGQLVCPYHGWHYGPKGTVTHVPSEGPGKPKAERACNPTYACVEQEGYVYVRLQGNAEDGIRPFPIPNYGRKGWHHVRLINFFRNSVINCAENFVDIPHTVFVHPSIFRKAEYRKLSALVRRVGGNVHVEYQNETSNLGWFSFFLNPKKQPIVHKDNFYLPNATSVEYVFSKHRHFFITSQSIPISAYETLVYTDLTYDYGIWNRITAPLVRWQAQKIIDQDIEIIGNQGDVLKKYGPKFLNSPADIIHVYIESILEAVNRGEDPRALPEKEKQIEFWV